ncbi:MAG: hypothetical protein WDZ41_03805 [Candidatus Babeliales bacterium]
MKIKIFKILLFFIVNINSIYGMEVTNQTPKKQQKFGLPLKKNKKALKEEKIKKELQALNREKEKINQLRLDLINLNKEIEISPNITNHEKKLEKDKEILVHELTIIKEEAQENIETIHILNQMNENLQQSYAQLFQRNQNLIAANRTPNQKSGISLWHIAVGSIVLACCNKGSLLPISELFSIGIKSSLATWRANIIGKAASFLSEKAVLLSLGCCIGTFRWLRQRI